MPRFLRPRHLLAPVKRVLPPPPLPGTSPAERARSAVAQRFPRPRRCAARAASPAAGLRAPARGGGTGSGGSCRRAPPGQPRGFPRKPSEAPGAPREPCPPVPGPSVPGTGKKRRRRYRPREPSGPAGGRTRWPAGTHRFRFQPRRGRQRALPDGRGAAPRGGCRGWRWGGTRRGGAPRAGAGCGARPGAASRGAAAFLPFLITD